MEKSGTWFSYQNERLGQGRDNVKQFLKDNLDIATKIEREVKEKLGLAKAEAPKEAKEAKEVIKSRK